MAITFHPKAGAILVCAYEPGFVAPEMVKVRPVIVVSPRLRRRDGLCAVVPLSTTPPTTIEDYHCEIRFERPLPSPWQSASCWAKCDMIAAVGFHRLDLIRLGRDHEGKRRYLNICIPDSDLRRIRVAVLHGLGLGALTPHLPESI